MFWWKRKHKKNKKAADTKTIRSSKTETSETSAEEVRRWFYKHVTENGKAYTLDAEQAEAVADKHKNTIVAARAGSGKTRTIVAKIIYLIAHEGVKPDEIIAFVFNDSAMKEINRRLRQMKVDGESVVPERAKIAYTFHSLAKRIVDRKFSEEGRSRGGILAEYKSGYVRIITKMMMGGKEMTDEDLRRLADQLESFINRAQQKYVTDTKQLAADVKKRLDDPEAPKSEKRFLRRGLECYKRYHQILLNEDARQIMGNPWHSYGTDFNLVMAWGASFILKGTMEEFIKNKKYILIDEYQDFSQLFFGMMTAMRKVTPEAKMFVVGDDWQAINRFAGSEVDYFKNFEKYFPEDVRRMEITTNYRCDYAIIDLAQRFMKKAMNETGRFRAASRRAGNVVLVKTKPRKEVYAETLADIIWANRNAELIMVLHRNNETHLKVSLLKLQRMTGQRLWQKYRMTQKEFNNKAHFMTMHKSKGLEAEVVILAEADAGVIPREHPDTHLYEMFGETPENESDDQKRLFYVAMTRAKKKLYIMYDGNKKDSFIHYLGNGLEEWEE